MWGVFHTLHYFFSIVFILMVPCIVLLPNFYIVGVTIDYRVDFYSIIYGVTFCISAARSGVSVRTRSLAQASP